MERPHNRAVTGAGPNALAAGEIVVPITVTEAVDGPPSRQKARRVEMRHAMNAYCRRCDIRWTTHNAAAVASVHASTYGHRVTVSIAASMAYVPAKPTRTHLGCSR